MTTKQMKPVLDGLVSKGLVQRTVHGRDAMYFVPKVVESDLVAYRREVKSFSPLKDYEARLRAAMVRR